MALPSDWATHYSGLAFQTRLAALGFVGAAIGAESVWARIDSAVLGFALLVIVASLGELNRRYTWSYLSACRAAMGASDVQWRAFVWMNEGPWKRRRGFSRFLLSWSTYVPGVAAGVYLVTRGSAVWQILIASG